MMTRTTTEVKVFDIKASGTVLFGHGWSDEIKGMVWADHKVWESDEECQRLLDEAIAEWEKARVENPWGTTPNEPTLRVYWIQQ